jgi:hypothetical protein
MLSYFTGATSAPARSDGRHLRVAAVAVPGHVGPGSAWLAAGA